MLSAVTALHTTHIHHMIFWEITWHSERSHDPDRLYSFLTLNAKALSWRKLTELQWIQALTESQLCVKITTVPWRGSIYKLKSPIMPHCYWYLCWHFVPNFPIVQLGISNVSLYQEWTCKCMSQVLWTHWSVLRIHNVWEPRPQKSPRLSSFVNPA